VYFGTIGTKRRSFTGVGVFSGDISIQTGVKAFEKAPLQITGIPAAATYTVAASWFNTGKVSGDTKLSQLMGKIIFIIDKTTAPEYMKYPQCNSSDENVPCYNLDNYMNMESGGDNLRIYSYSRITNQAITPPEIRDDGITTDTIKYKMVIPDAGTSMKIFGILRNPNFDTLVADYGVQIACYRFYENDTNLMNYEEAFSKHKSAFVPISKMIKYLEQQK
jgi:hypothetical protein